MVTRKMHFWLGIVMSVSPEEAGLFVTFIEKALAPVLVSDKKYAEGTVTQIMRIMIMVACIFVTADSFFALFTS